MVGADTDPVGQRASRAITSRAGLPGPAIKVKVRDGVASLSGKVPTVYEAMLAYRAVQRTPGVREIEDRLEFVVPDGSTPNPLIEKGRPDDVEPYLQAQIRRQVGDLAHVDRGPGPGRLPGAERDPGTGGRPPQVRRHPPIDADPPRVPAHGRVPRRDPVRFDGPANCGESPAGGIPRPSR